MTNTTGLGRTMGSSGVQFDDSTGRCTVRAGHALPGAVSVAAGIAAGYLLFFRPDITGPVTPVILVLRTVFPFGFGLLGLAMLGSRTRIEFDRDSASFSQVDRVAFTVRRRRASFGEITAVQVDATYDVVTKPDSGGRGWQWNLTLAAVVGGEPVTVAVWTWRIPPDGRPEEAVDDARALGGRLADLVGCPFEFLPDRRLSPKASHPHVGPTVH